MALFLSSFTNGIDTKGRISVPASFRAAVAAENFGGIVLFRSFTNKCIEGFGMNRMEKMAAATDQLGAFDKTQDDLTAMLFADARPLQFDVSGRVVIPEDLLKHADISGEAVFVGRGNSFQIWNPREFAKAQNESLARLQKSNPSLKI
ncbi:MAG: division/cell wall cluster transcriptional repressor MraZ [Rickettsiales bacterium]|jgi:MraZ protein|nr:division/cell wall cluster transcriptional repressor MraZ [Rickettsiales bacterium]